MGVLSAVARSGGPTSGGDGDEGGQWRGTTAEERAAERRERLLAAAFDLLATQGAAGVSVRAVVRESGLSPRFFYESFADRDALLLALWDEQYALVALDVARAVAPVVGDFSEGMRAALLAVAAWFEEHPPRAAVMLHQTLAEPLLRDHAQRRLPELVLATLSLAVPSGTLEDLPGRSLDIAVVAMSGAILNLFLEWTAGRLDVGAPVLADAIVEVASTTMSILLQRES